MVPLAGGEVVELLASVAESVNEVPAGTVVEESAVLSVVVATAVPSAMPIIRFVVDVAPPQPVLTELQAMLLDASHLTVMVKVDAVVNNPVVVSGMKYVYCPVPLVVAHARPLARPAVVTVRSRHTVLLPTPESGTSKMSMPDTLRKALGESPVKVNVVVPMV